MIGVVAVTRLVELFYGGAWNDHSSSFLNRDPTTITRGRADQASRTAPATLTLTVNNKDGRFTPANPHSPLYGLIGRNTPIRVTVSGSVRFVGEVVAWPQRWDMSGRDVFVPLEAAGIMRRLGGSGGRPKPTPSAMRRAILAASPELAAYWSLEDGPRSTAGVNLASRRNEMQSLGPVNWAGFDDQSSGSAPLPDLSFTAGDPVPELFGRVDGTYADWTVGFAVAFDDGGPWNALTVFTRNTQFEQIRVTFQGGVSNIEVRGVNEAGVATMLLTSGQVLFDGKLHWLELRTSRVATTVTVTLFIDGTGITSGNFTANDAGDPYRVRPAGSSDRQTAVVGHIGIWRTTSSIFGDVVAAVRGHAGETAGRRVERLCAENGVAFVGLGDLDATARMGAQRPLPLLDLLAECETVDRGLLHETRTALGLTYRTDADLLNQAAAVSLDYAAGQVSPPFHPDEDDQQTVNDVEATRRGGSSARDVLTSGPLSTADPPDGVGIYDAAVQFVAESDLHLVDLASWLLHVGTWPSARYPMLRLDLRRMTEILGNTVLRDAVLTLDSGSRVDVTGLPVWLPPEDASLLVNGYDETVAADQHEITFNASPYGPYVVGVYAAAAEVPGPAEPMRTSPLDSRVNTSFTVGTNTALSVADQTGGNDRWSQTADFPFDIRVRHPDVGGSGVRLRVTAVGAPAAGVQTLTVQQAPINDTSGVTAAVGWVVELWQPAVYAL